MCLAFIFSLAAVVLCLGMIKVQVMYVLSPTGYAIRMRSNIRQGEDDGLRAGVAFIGTTRHGIKRDNFCIIVMEGGLILVRGLNVVTKCAYPGFSWARVVKAICARCFFYKGSQDGNIAYAQ